jgi:hypothetical protein
VFCLYIHIVLIMYTIVYTDIYNKRTFKVVINFCPIVHSLLIVKFFGKCNTLQNLEYHLKLLAVIGILMTVHWHILIHFYPFSAKQNSAFS